MAQLQREILKCSGDPNDYIEVFNDADSLNVELRSHTDVRGSPVFLDEARARALFNWLGVWLHRPRP